MLKRTKAAKARDLDVVEILSVSIHGAHDPRMRSISFTIGEGYTDPDATLGWTRTGVTSHNLLHEQAAEILDGGVVDDFFRALYKAGGERGRFKAPARLPDPEEEPEEFPDADGA